MKSSAATAASSGLQDHKAVHVMYHDVLGTPSVSDSRLSGAAACTSLRTLLVGACSGSRQLLRSLFRSSVLDSISLYGGLAIFFLVVVYILQVCCWLFDGSAMLVSQALHGIVLKGSLIIMQKRTLYFAPIGRVMAPVAGTAWNASRSAAQRAGQLPSAVLALHRWSFLPRLHRGSIQCRCKWFRAAGGMLAPAHLALHCSPELT